MRGDAIKFKQIINGKKYDTETAGFLIGGDNGLDPSQDSYAFKALFRKNNGDYFLYHKFNDFSDYNQFNGTTTKEFIEPFDNENAAKNHCLAFLSIDDYEKIFGEVAE